MGKVRWGEPLVEEPPALADNVEKLGYGWGQVKFALLAVLPIFTAGAMEVLGGAMNRTSSVELGWTHHHAGFIFGTALAGRMLGGIVGGAVGDLWGRRPAALLCAWSLTLALMARPLCRGYATLTVSRFLLGVSLGLVGPAYALVSEIGPAAWRLTSVALVQAFEVAGEVSMATLSFFDENTLESLHWHSMVLLVSFIPGMLMLPFLIESPRWLAWVGRHPEAREALRAIAMGNGRRNACLEFKAELSPAQTLPSGLRTIFGPRYMWSTLVLSFQRGCLDFAVLGSIHATGLLSPEAGAGLDTGAAGWLFHGALLPLAVLLASVAGSAWPRIPGIGLAFAAMALCTAIFALGQDVGNHFLTGAALMALKIVPSVLLLVHVTYTAEIYPTCSRARGVSVVAIAGQLGALAAPLAYEAVTAYSRPETFFYACSALHAACAVLSPALPFETAGARLVDREDEEFPGLCKASGGPAVTYGATEGA